MWSETSLPKAVPKDMIVSYPLVHVWASKSVATASTCALMAGSDGFRQILPNFIILDCVRFPDASGRISFSAVLKPPDFSLALS
jgi:hypothetical protein